jgi:AcrR family transcriptional regulator
MGKSVSRKRIVAAPPAPADEESAHSRLLNAATRLFCKNGINATGIDAIIEEAGTAKTTL